MYVILTYDVKKKRLAKVMKTCRKYLLHVQKSVFEGQLTEGTLNRLKKELANIVVTDEDAVCIYEMESLKYTKKEKLGVVENHSCVI